jgi:hypothetical protein
MRNLAGSYARTSTVNIFKISELQPLVGMKLFILVLGHLTQQRCCLKLGNNGIIKIVQVDSFFLRVFL